MNNRFAFGWLACAGLLVLLSASSPVQAQGKEDFFEDGPSGAASKKSDSPKKDTSKGDGKKASPPREVVELSDASRKTFIKMVERYREKKDLLNEAEKKTLTQITNFLVSGKAAVAFMQKSPALLNSMREKADGVLNKFTSQPDITAEEKKAVEEVSNYIKSIQADDPNSPPAESKETASTKPTGKSDSMDPASKKGKRRFRDEAPAEKSEPAASKDTAASKMDKKPDAPEKSPSADKSAPTTKAAAKVAEAKNKADDKSAETEVAKSALSPNHDKLRNADNSKSIRWKKVFDDAIDEAKSNGKPIFILFTSDNNPAIKTLDEETFKDIKIINTLNAFFVSLRLDGDKLKDEIKEWKIQGTPAGQAVVIRFNKELVTTLKTSMKTEEWVPALDGALEKVLTLDALAGPATLRRSLENAEKELADSKYAAAYRALKKLADREEHLIEIKRAREVLAKIEATAVERLEEAKRLADEKDFAGAAKMLKKFQNEYDGTPLRERAMKLESQMMETPEAKNASRVAAALALEQQADEDLRNNRFSQAIKKLKQLVKDYPEQPAVRMAKWRLERLENDPRRTRMAKDEEAGDKCRRLLSVARTYLKNGRRDRAKEYLKRVIDEYPGTSFADEASKELADIPQ